MSSQQEKPDTEKVLRSLKDFQRKTVDYIFERMYVDEKPSKRFLCADEVGLGKTLVAKGVIAKTIEHLWDKVKRIDIIYICSNSDIARQNVNRLNISNKKDFALASRVTLLPTKIQNLRENRLNFVSFTPGTSFEMKSSMGQGGERALLYQLLKDTWEMKGMAPLHVLRGHKNPESFKAEVEYFAKEEKIDSQIKDLFLKSIQSEKELRKEWDDLCGAFPRENTIISDEMWGRRSQFVSQLRDRLAKACLNALEPDLIILDEFQRFKTLLSGEGEAAQLAKDLFNFQCAENSARVLMLSATPYKMYTQAHESADDDHYKDFLATLRFLQDDELRTEATQKLLMDYRRKLMHLDTTSKAELELAKSRLESTLRKVMVRTEKLATAGDRHGMLVDVPCRTTKSFSKHDVSSFSCMEQVAENLSQPGIIEYWKSAPFMLNFMDDYLLKQEFDHAASRKKEGGELHEILKRAPQTLLPWKQITKYAEVDYANPRLREMIATIGESSAWKTLWLPPSAPYYSLAEPFASVAKSGFTKRLVFSSWKMVPKAVSTLLSYEVERRIFKQEDPDASNTPEDRKRRKSRLGFSKAEGRLTAMPVFALIYPSLILSSECNPLTLFQDSTEIPSAEAMQQAAFIKVSHLMPHLEPFALKEGPIDERWYWVAPLLLDRVLAKAEAQQWFKSESLAGDWCRNFSEDADEKSYWDEHVSEARKIVEGSNIPMGPMPADIISFLAQLGLAGLGNSALRTLQSVSEGGTYDPAHCRLEAARLAYDLLFHFGHPEPTALIRGLYKMDYWRSVLNYCYDGCFQAVLDEYAHTLIESRGLMDRPINEVVTDLSDFIGKTSKLRASSLGVDEIKLGVRSDGVSVEERSLRTRFAMRFGDEKAAQGDDGSRGEQVKDAFNSPFWPFVLISTSVGQEGLDFHTYCHAIVHWNLPSNPLDLEQREGRIHRYKGHAVRKNVAKKYGHLIFNARGKDVWAYLFSSAKADCLDLSDLTPYWIFPIVNGAQIERHVPAMPLSRDSQRMADLRKTLASYRLVFGHFRQEDLLAHLIKCSGDEDMKDKLGSLSIELSPEKGSNDP